MRFLIFLAAVPCISFADELSDLKWEVQMLKFRQELNQDAAAFQRQSDLDLNATQQQIDQDYNDSKRSRTNRLNTASDKK